MWNVLEDIDNLDNVKQFGKISHQLINISTIQDYNFISWQVVSVDLVELSEAHLSPDFNLISEVQKVSSFHTY